MTRLDVCTTLSHLAFEFDRLRLRLAARLTTAEEGAFLGLVCALEEVRDRLPLLLDKEKDPRQSETPPNR